MWAKDWDIEDEAAVGGEYEEACDLGRTIRADKVSRTGRGQGNWLIAVNTSGADNEEVM